MRKDFLSTNDLFAKCCHDRRIFFCVITRCRINSNNSVIANFSFKAGSSTLISLTIALRVWILFIGSRIVPK